MGAQFQVICPSSLSSEIVNVSQTMTWFGSIRECTSVRCTMLYAVPRELLRVVDVFGQTFDRIGFRMGCKVKADAA